MQSLPSKKNKKTNNLDNFRPISKLPLLKNIGLLNHHSAPTICPVLPAFRNISLPFPYPPHYRHTALLKVTNDLLLASNSVSLIILLLNLSAAFDTIDHTIQLNHLQSYFGITGSAFTWFTSYLSNRVNFVFINNLKSHTSLVTHRIPQGLVFGPLLFILYMLPLCHIVCHHRLHFHCYTDNTQLYISSKSSLN